VNDTAEQIAADVFVPPPARRTRGFYEHFQTIEIRLVIQILRGPLEAKYQTASMPTEFDPQA
jgi:hypothetical protein